MYMFKSSGPLTEKKLSEHEVATAFARSVLPVPGGPYNRIPVRKLACEARDETQAQGTSERT